MASGSSDNLGVSSLSISSGTTSSENKDDMMKLDLLILTFNCAKAFVDIGVFATHLHEALSGDAAQLPEVVVFSLQEVAPLPHSFIGGSFLEPYLSRFEEALNLAAVNVSTSVSEDEQSSPGRPYVLVKSHNVGMTAILLFARDPTQLSPVEVAEVGFGAAEMGNKGAVGFRTVYSQGTAEATTELTFVATHLAAMEWNVARRNANWHSIMRALTFSDPEAVVKEFGEDVIPEEGPEGVDEDGEDIGLLVQRHRDSRKLLDDNLHNLSVFKPSSHLFLAGDLNYRIATTPPPPNAVFPSHDRNAPDQFERFLPLDQLSQERKAGRTLHGLSEAPIHFPPTYKYKVLLRTTPLSELELSVPAVFAQHRYPAWTDRILYLDIPSWLQESPSSPKITVTRYDSLPLMRSSDHQPVYLRALIPLIPPTTMRPPPGVTDETPDPSISEEDARKIALWREDPRVRLPVGIEPEAWGRRRAGRRKEWIVGWGSAVWGTRQGAVVLGGVLVILGAIWLGWQVLMG